MNYTNKEKLELIRCESIRIWSYLKESIDWIEYKYYLNKELDEAELLVYCKSCEESLEEIEKITYELEQDIWRLENE